MTFGIIDNTLEGRQRAYFPHWFSGMVPMDREKNLRWREYLYNLTDRGMRKRILRMCSEDPLFYICSAVWIFDADSDSPRPVPFVLYPFQIEILTVLFSLLYEERGQGRVKKNRRMGVTYLVLWLLEHCWHFKNDRHIMIGSHREVEVDSALAMAKQSRFTVETKTLLGKVDFGHAYMPPWMLPDGYTPREEPCCSKMVRRNPETRSVLWGTSSSGVAGAGERGFAVFWDEAALTENLYDIIGALSEFTPVKFWVSTIDDLGHPFSTILKDAPGVRQIEPHWWMHPEYSVDMEIDPETGERTSPWLRRSLAAINHDPILANRHYFADETRQVGGYYHAKVFEAMLGTERAGSIFAKPKTVMDPFHVGEFDIIDTPDGPKVARWLDQRGGRWKLWTPVDTNGRVDRGGRYFGAADIAAGTGRSDSVLAFADGRKGELVAELSSNRLDAVDLARQAVAVGRWFEGDDGRAARISFEANGPWGGKFGQKLVEWGYPNLQRRADGALGWLKSNNRETEDAFAEHHLAICEGRFKERSIECVAEMRQYQKPSSGKGPPIHSAAKHAEDPELSGDNHGDRVITRVVLCDMLRHPLVEDDPELAAPALSYRAHRERKAREKRVLARA